MALQHKLGTRLVTLAWQASATYSDRRSTGAVQLALAALLAHPAQSLWQAGLEALTTLMLRISGPVLKSQLVTRYLYSFSFYSHLPYIYFYICMYMYTCLCMMTNSHQSHHPLCPSIALELCGSAVSSGAT